VNMIIFFGAGFYRTHVQPFYPEITIFKFEHL